MPRWDMASGLHSPDRAIKVSIRYALLERFKVVVSMCFLPYPTETQVKSFAIIVDEMPIFRAVSAG